MDIRHKIAYITYNPPSVKILDNCRNEADTTKFRPQLTEETTAIARPLKVRKFQNYNLVSSILQKKVFLSSALASKKWLNLSIGNWVLYSGMLLYLHHRNSKLFFILQSLAISKMRKFQTIKLHQFHKAKFCWIDNCWSSRIMSNFYGDKQFFYIFLKNT